MANPVFNGFQWWGTLSAGEGVMPSTQKREVANNIGTGIYRYDAIAAVSDGTCAAAATSDNGKLLGVAIGFSMLPSQPLPGRRPTLYIPASTTFSPTTVGSPNAPWVEYIPFTPDNIFAVNGNAAAPTATAAGVVGLIGENCDLVAGTGDTTTGLSAMLLDLSSHATTTANFRIVGIVGYPGQQGGTPLNNDPTLTSVRFLVTCNEGFYPSYTATGV